MLDAIDFLLNRAASSPTPTAMSELFLASFFRDSLSLALIQNKTLALLPLSAILAAHRSSNGSPDFAALSPILSSDMWL